MSNWQKPVERWRKSGPQPEEDWGVVRDWLQEDPVWKGSVFATSRGSHEFVVKVQGISQIIPKIQMDTFSVSRKGNRVKRWQIELLVKIYEQLLTLE